MYLTGTTNDRDEPSLVAAGVGLMVQPGNGYLRRADRYPFIAADNGCFNARWKEDHWLDWLPGVPTERCLFAVAPDVYPDARATLERSYEFLELIRSLGLPVALVAQDGAESLSLPWEEFDCLFIGGEKKKRSKDEWKVSDAAAGLVRRARDKGKWVHMGRCNSLARMERARQMGCNSADGTFIKYRRRQRRGERPDARDLRGASELVHWMAWLKDNQPLDLVRFETPELPIYKSALNS